MEDIVSKDIMAILPMYIGGMGNVTHVYTREGVLELGYTIKTVIRKLSEYYCLDLKSCNKTYGGLLSSRYRPPIPFNSDNIFIQFKTRIPIAKHDGAYGYFNINSIKKTKSQGKSTIIYLLNDEEIEAFMSIYTVKKHVSQILAKLNLADRTQAALFIQSRLQKIS